MKLNPRTNPRQSTIWRPLLLISFLLPVLLACPSCQLLQPPVSVAEAPAPTPTPVADCSTFDSDNDGVGDCVDECPGTSPDSKVHNSGCPIQGGSKLESFFPWPAPRPTTWLVLDPKLFKQSGKSSTIGYIVKSINKALDYAGYGEHSYYSVPGGLAIATRLEQIDDTGAPKQPGRFSPYYSMPQFTLKEIVRQLILAPKGHWRSVVFVVTPNPMMVSEKPPAEVDVEKWAKNGASKPNQHILTKKYTKETDVIALIYQFDKRYNVDSGHLVESSDIDANTHLAKSNILQGLKEQQ